MANFSDLPTEVQLLIVRDLPKSKLFELKSFNSLFLDGWMDTRWKYINVNLENPDLAVRLLQRVVDPFVATRPEILTIQLRQPPSSAELTSKSFAGAFTVLLDSLPLLPNIISLNIRVFQRNFTIDVVTFYQRLASFSFARKLQCLILLGTVGMLMPLWECSAHWHNTPFESLTRLNLCLADDATMQTKFSPSLEHFLRSLAPTLQCLQIWTAGDLSPLLNALVQPLPPSQSHSSVPFPNLTSLFLPIFSKRSWRDPQSLHRFLLTHTNLLHLSLDLHDWPTPESERLVGALLTELANHNNQFSSLQTLDIYPSATQAGLSALLTLIKRSALTLTSLVIPTRYLTDEEVIRVVDALTEGEVRLSGTTTASMTPEEPRKLEYLNMRITRLSVPFLDLLARKLPQLEELTLRIKHITSSDEDSLHDELYRRRYDPDTTCSQDVLHAWKLQDLAIYSYSDQVGETRLKRAECAVAGAVPALACRLE